MKKPYAFVVLILLVASVSLNASSRSLGINAQLHFTPVLPNFTIYGGLEQDNYTAMGSSNSTSYTPGATNVISTETDITQYDVVVYIKIVQFGIVHYSTASSGPISITVAATELVQLTDDENKARSALPVIVSNSIWPDPDPLSEVHTNTVDVNDDGSMDFISTVSSVDNENASITFSVEYPTGVRVHSVEKGKAVSVGGLAFKWQKMDGDCPVGTYIANVVMAFEVN